MRIGQGYDIHRFTEGRPLILGGITIPHAKGLAGHSDADVVIHALCDAILGAMAAGDIGRHFPDTDPTLKDIDSRKLFKRVRTLMDKNRYSLSNADITILAQEPKMAPHIPEMQKIIAADLDVAPGQINIKATTTEGMDSIGRGEGIAAHAVVLLETGK